MRVICYHTPKYAGEAERLRASLMRVGQDCAITAVDEFADWHAAVAHKAEFLAETREVAAGPLLYVDADAVFHRRIKADEMTKQCGDAAIGVHYHQRGAKLGSGTIYLPDSGACRAALRLWRDENAGRSAMGEMRGHGQRSLQDAIDRHGIEVWRMPARYCYIHDLSPRWDPLEPVVIEHLQASRQFKTPSTPSKLLPSRLARLAELEAAR